MNLLLAFHLPHQTSPTPPAGNADAIVARSVANNQADWKVAPQFSFVEHDKIWKGGQDWNRTTYKVLMIDGSPYNETIAVNGKTLSPDQRKREEQKLARVTQQRAHESPSARARRIAAYQNGRRQDHLLMREMIAAFVFKLAGMEVANGRQCYRVEAAPKPGYVPNSRDTQVLKGMKGTLWIDVHQYQWVRVEASVFRPVTFGLFIAHVHPGTEFVLEEAPVEGNIWMPSYFETKVEATILFWPHNSLDEETYTGYQRIGNAGN